MISVFNLVVFVEGLGLGRSRHGRAGQADGACDTSGQVGVTEKHQHSHIGLTIVVNTTSYGGLYIHLETSPLSFRLLLQRL